MSKKIIIVLVVVVASMSGVWFTSTILSNKSEKPLRSNAVNSNIKVNPELESTDKVYEDTSGFSFQYPSEVTISEDLNSLGADFYSHLVFQKGQDKGEFIVKDVKYSTVDEMIFKDPDVKGAELVGATSMYEIPAKQYKKSGNFITLAIDQSVLYMIKTSADEYWQNVQDKIINSFTILDNPVPTNIPQSNTPSNIIYEAEEIIE